jgi:hypothetical protein
MKYLLQQSDDDRYHVINDDADSFAASVYALKRGKLIKAYCVEIEVPGSEECHEILIKSIDEAIPAVAVYYEANPPRWEPESELTPRYDEMGPCLARYVKQTQFGCLWVDQIESGQWVAYRSGHELRRDDGKIAKFATSEEAQRAADAHFRDGYPNSEEVNDGLSWPCYLNWWADPYRVASRARLAVP